MDFDRTMEENGGEFSDNVAKSLFYSLVRWAYRKGVFLSKPEIDAEDNDGVVRIGVVVEAKTIAEHLADTNPKECCRSSGGKRKWALGNQWWSLYNLKEDIEGLVAELFAPTKSGVGK